MCIVGSRTSLLVRLHQPGRHSFAASRKLWVEFSSSIYCVYFLNINTRTKYILGISHRLLALFFLWFRVGYSALSANFRERNNFMCRLVFRLRNLLNIYKNMCWEPSNEVCSWSCGKKWNPLKLYCSDERSISFEYNKGFFFFGLRLPIQWRSHIHLTGVLLEL